MFRRWQKSGFFRFVVVKNHRITGKKLNFARLINSQRAKSYFTNMTLMARNSFGANSAQYDDDTDSNESSSVASTEASSDDDSAEETSDKSTDDDSEDEAEGVKEDSPVVRPPPPPPPVGAAATHAQESSAEESSDEESSDEKNSDVDGDDQYYEEEPVATSSSTAEEKSSEEESSDNESEKESAQDSDDSESEEVSKDDSESESDSVPSHVKHFNENHNNAHSSRTSSHSNTSGSEDESNDDESKSSPASSAVTSPTHSTTQGVPSEVDSPDTEASNKQSSAFEAESDEQESPIVKNATEEDSEDEASKSSKDKKRNKTKERKSKKVSVAQVAEVKPEVDMMGELASLNDGLSAFILNQRPPSGKMLLSPAARAILEDEKDQKRRGRAPSPEPKATMVDDVSPLESPELATHDAAKATDEPVESTETDTAEPPEVKDLTQAMDEAAGGTIASPDEIVAEAEGEKCDSALVAADAILNNDKVAIAAEGTGEALNSFLSQIADNEDKVAGSDSDGFDDKNTDNAAPIDVPPSEDIPLDEHTLDSIVPPTDAPPECYKISFDSMRSCPYVPALVKFVGYADDFEHCMVSVHKGIFYVRIGESDNEGDEVFLAKFTYDCPERDEAFVEEDKSEVDQFFFSHKWHGVVCIRVAIEHKFLIFDTFPEELFQPIEIQRNHKAHQGMNFIPIGTSGSPTAENKDTGKKKITKDFIAANKVVNPNATRARTRPETDHVPTDASGKPVWTNNGPKRGSIVKNAGRGFLEGGELSPKEIKDTDVQGVHRSSITSAAANNGPVNSMLRNEGNLVIRRRSVEYLLQGVAVTEIEMLNSNALSETIPLPKQKISLLHEASGTSVCNNSRHIADGVMEKYSSRGKDYRTTRVSRARGLLLCRWLNSLNLQSVQFTMNNLHENLCSGLFLADLVRLLIPSSASKFSHMHVPAVSKTTALSNLEQCLGIILRSKSFVFSERIPKPIEVVEACGSGNVGHQPKDALILARRNTNRLLTLIDELFRAFVMKDFIAFSVDVPTMIAQNIQTTASKQQRRRSSYLMLAKEKLLNNQDHSGLNFEGDRYRSGGAFMGAPAHVQDESAKRAKKNHSKDFKPKAAKSTFGASAKRPSYIQNLHEKETEKMVDREEANAAGAPEKCSLRDYEVASAPSSPAPKIKKRPDVELEIKHGNVPIPTRRLIEMLEWYQGVLKVYQRGFSSNVCAYIEKCSRAADDKNMLKSLNANAGLADALEGVWSSMQSGVALFCIIMHFYGHGTTLDYDGLDSTSNAHHTNNAAKDDDASIGKLRTSTGLTGSSSTALRIDPIFIYAIPRTKGEHHSNITYLFRLMYAIGITNVWNVNDWLFNPDPDFLILQLYDIYVSVGHLGSAQCVLPTKKSFHAKNIVGNGENQGTVQKAPFKDESGSEYSTESDDDETGANIVHIVQVAKDNMHDAYIEGLYFADDLGFGEHGDNDIDVALMDGFGGRFDLAKKGAEAAKAELKEVIPVYNLTGRESKLLSIPKNDDIQLEIDRRFDEALKRNQKALGGASNIARLGIGLGGTIDPDITAAGGVVNMLLSESHAVDSKAASYKRIMKERSILTHAKKELSKNQYGKNEGNYLHDLFNSIREFEAERGITKESQKHHPSHKQTLATDQEGHHHRHYTTGELLLRALVVGDDDDGDDLSSESDDSSDDSSVEYSVDSDGEIKIDNAGELKVHINKEKKIAQQAEKARVKADREASKLKLKSQGKVFDFSDILYLNLGIDYETKDVKCFRIKSLDRDDTKAPLEFMNGYDLIEAEAKNQMVQHVVRAVTGIAELYADKCEQDNALNKEEDEIEADYIALEEAARSKKVGKEEFDDKMNVLEKREKQHATVTKSSKSRFLIVLDSLALQYAEAVRESISEEDRLVDAEEPPSPPPVGEPGSPAEAGDGIAPPSSPSVRQNRASNIQSKNALLIGKNENRTRHASPSMKKKMLLKDRERDYIGAHMSNGTPPSTYTTGLFSKITPLSSNERHDHVPILTTNIKSGSKKKSGQVITLFSDLAAAEEKDDDKNRLKVRTKKEKFGANVHISEVTGKKKIVSKDTTIREAFSASVKSSISPHTKMSVTDIQHFEGGWNQSHASSIEKSHNKMLTKKVNISISKKLQVNTPNKLRQRLMAEGGIYSHGMFADGHKPNILERVGLPELDPPKFVNSAVHGADAYDRAKLALQHAYDEQPVRSYFSFLTDLQNRRNSWLDARGLHLPKRSIVSTGSPPDEVIEGLEASTTQVNASMAAANTSISAEEKENDRKQHISKDLDDEMPQMNKTLIATVGPASTKEDGIEEDQLSLSSDSASKMVPEDESIVTISSLALSSVRGSAKLAATSAKVLIDKDDTSVLEQSTLLVRPVDDQRDVQLTDSPRPNAMPISDKKVGRQSTGVTTRSGAVYTIEDSGAADLADYLPVSKQNHPADDNASDFERHMNVLQGEHEHGIDDSDADSDYVPSIDDSETDSVSDSDSSDIAVEDIPSMSDTAVEKALKWLSVPRPVRQLDSIGSSLNCTFMLANDVTGYRVVGPASTAAGYRNNQLYDLHNIDDLFTYTAENAQQGNIRAVLQIRDGEGVVPIHVTPSRLVYIQDIVSISYYDENMEEIETSTDETFETSDHADAGGASTPSSPYSKLETLRINATEDYGTLEYAPHPNKTSSNNVVRLQLKSNHRRSVLAGNGRPVVLLAFNNENENDARDFITHLLTLVHSLPSALEEQDNSQREAAETRKRLIDARTARKEEKRLQLAAAKVARINEQKRQRAAALARIENKKRTNAALKAVKIAKAKKKSTKAKAKMDLKRGKTPDQHSVSNSNDEHTNISATLEFKEGEDVHLYNPPRKFQCVFEHGAFIRALPIPKRFIKTSEDQIGEIDRGDIVLVKCVHRDVSKTTSFTHLGVQAGGSYLELVSPQGKAAGWVPCFNGTFPILEPFIIPQPGYPNSIVFADPEEAEENGDINKNDPKRMKEVRAAIRTLVELYDDKNSDKISELLIGWQNKEVCLLHILHEQYALKVDRDEDLEFESESDSIVLRKMRIAEQHAHAATTDAPH